MKFWVQFNFQESGSPIIERLKQFNDYSIAVIARIIALVLYIYFFHIANEFINLNFVRGHFIEFLWTIVPGIILILIAIPRLKLLYIIEAPNNPFITIKVTGNQWNWRYEYDDLTHIEFTSYIIPTDELTKPEKRNLERDHRVVVPVNEPIQFLITRRDVIHRWAVPRLGIKVDAVPGRLNKILNSFNRPGVFFGQCSEICGANHRFIPIRVEIISLNDFIKWI